MGDITEWLHAANSGDRSGMERVFEQLYPELHRIAAARMAFGTNTLSPTALVHESYLRLVGSAELSLQGRLHFLACAGRAMRMILIDHMRRRNAQKRGGGVATTATLEGAIRPLDIDWLALEQALDRLQHVNADLRELVDLHFFAGVEFQEIAELRRVDERTVRRHWQRAKSLLHQWL